MDDSQNKKHVAIRTGKGKDADSMEEILIRKRVAIKHPNNTFDYSKYQNALSIDTVEREDGWIEYFATFRLKGTLGNRRKGIAIFGTGTLIDSNNNEIATAYKNGRFYRIFGGYYVNLITRNYNYRTFPGQDRETEYEQMQIVYAIFDEDGMLLDYKKSIAVFDKIDILQALTAIELGNNRVFYKNAIYDLKDYTLISKFSKKIVINGVFVNGLCKVLIPDDNQDFIIAVHNNKIIHTFSIEEFDQLKNILKIEIKEDEQPWNTSKIKYDVELDYDEIIIDEYYPIVEITIDKYLASTPTHIIEKGGIYQLEPNFNDDFINNFQKSPHYTHWLSHRYYKDVREDRYLHISHEGYEQLYKKMCMINDNRPNFISKVSKLGHCTIFGKENLNYKENEIEYDIYRFECRPYGYITTSGELIYDFDVNNIKW